MFMKHLHTVGNFNIFIINILLNKRTELASDWSFSLAFYLLLFYIKGFCGQGQPKINKFL